MLDRQHTEEARSRAGGPSLRQPVFNWAAKDKHKELKHFEMEVMNVFLVTNYDISDTEIVAIINKKASMF